MNRLGHVVLAALATGAGVALEQLVQPSSALGHLGAWSFLAAAAIKWLHFEATKLGGSGVDGP